MFRNLKDKALIKQYLIFFNIALGIILSVLLTSWFAYVRPSQINLAIAQNQYGYYDIKNLPNKTGEVEVDYFGKSKIVDLENSNDFSYNIENDSIDATTIIKNFLIELDGFLNQSNLSENEIKLGHALYELFDNYNEVFIGNDNNKFNKNVVLLSLREMTNLSTKEIRSSMKKFKTIYFSLIEKMVK